MLRMLCVLRLLRLLLRLLLRSAAAAALAAAPGAAPGAARAAASFPLGTGASTTIRTLQHRRDAASSGSAARAGGSLRTLSPVMDSAGTRPGVPSYLISPAI